MTQKNPKVYVVQATAHDLTSADKYGLLSIILPTTRDATYAPQPVIRLMRQKLKDFSDDDFLLLVGDPVAAGIAVAVAADINQGRVNVLKWSKMNNAYYPIKVDFYDRQPKEN